MGWRAAGPERRGSLVGGRYRLVERLGAGGMSVVWRAHDEVLGRPVAVKVLAPQLVADSRFRSRLRLEALAAARLCHPHVTGVFDLGSFPRDAADDLTTVPYVVMELNDGEPVSARLRREGAFPWRAAVTVAAEVASALATAHARGVVHRDVTPANIMLTGTGAKIVDFGISGVTGQRDAAPDGSLLGTPAYLAPERLGGGPVAPPADVYALGLLLYRMLTGRLPWAAENTTEVLRAHLYADPEPLPALPGLPDEVPALTLRCLAKQPADRPGAGEIATVLAGLVGLRPVIPEPGARDVLPALAGFPRVPHPGPLPRQRPARLLRTGLRLGRALRIGVPRPLGGGLFRSDRVRPGTPRLTDLILSGRQRIHATAATVVLIAAIGLAWVSIQEPVDVTTAQAAAAGAGPVPVPHGTGCKVRYRVQHDTGTDFGAQLTVVNTGEHGLRDWHLAFAFTGGQRLTEGPKRLGQQGRRVVLRAKKGTELRPGRAASVTLAGSYRASNPLPLSFTLNGHPCRSEVLGAVTVTSPSPPPSSAPATSRSQRSPAPARPPRESRPAPGKPTPAPAPPPANPRAGIGGFSVAI